MILNNYAKLLWANMCNKSATSAKITLISGGALTNTYIPYFGSSSDSISIANYSGGNTTTSSTSSTYVNFSNISLTFGSGTTEPTADDYQMESPYDTTNHFSWENHVQSGVADSITKVITASIANISEENLTVSEIGVVMFHSTYNHTLIARSVIAPVTIAPAETKTFQYTLDFTGLAG